MRFRHGLLITGMALLGPRSEAHPEDSAERARVNALIAAEPDNADLYLRRAAQSAEHGEWSAAEPDLQRARELAPASERVRVTTGRIYLAADRLREAGEQLDAALALAPRNAEALVLQARVRSRLGQIAAAHADYSRAIDLLAEPSPGLFLERAALPISSLAALRGIDEGIARLGPAAPLLERALALELRLGRTEAALARLDALAAGAERKEVFLKRRGDILAVAGRAVEARAAYASALAAIAALPAWLRESPEVAQLGRELTRLAASPQSS
jgi:predicted Zn-dependent protease